jgi:Ubiquitinol-cytochrome C reductase Fe-S subunit TAT signal
MADVAQPRTGGCTHCGLGVVGAPAAVWPRIDSMEPAKDTLALNTAEAAGTKAVTDDEQGKESFGIYSIHSLMNIAADGIPISFEDGRHALCLFTTLAADPAMVPTRRLGRWLQ